MEVVQGALDAIGPWIGTIGPLPLLFIALVRGWLLTPASVQKVHDSQEARIDEMEKSYDVRMTELKDNYEARLAEAREREHEWKAKTEEALEIIQAQTRQLDVVTELGETSVKLLEAVHSAKFGAADIRPRKVTHVIHPGKEGGS